MSTPRRPCPRSSGAPMTAILVLPDGAVTGSGPQPVEHARKRDGFAHVFEAANPRHTAFNAHAEAAVRYSAVLAQIDVPVEGFAREAVFVNAPQQQVGIVNALAAADDFAVAFGRQDVDAHRYFGPVRIGLHVERFDGGREAIDHDGTV